MQIDTKFNIGDFVYIITDEDNIRGIITALSVMPNGITYRVSRGVEESYHYDFELSEEKTIV